MTILESLNWVDIFIIATVVRSVYIGMKKGVVTEIFKLIGIFFTVFIVLHYFGSMTQILDKRFHIPIWAGRVFSYLFLWALVGVIFKFLREGMTALFHIEAHSTFDKWGGLFLATLRALLICSLVLVFLRVSRIDGLIRSTGESYFALPLVHMAPRFYESAYYGFVKKLFPDEKLNKDAFPFKKAVAKDEVPAKNQSTRT